MQNCNCDRCYVKLHGSIRVYSKKSWPTQVSTKPSSLNRSIPLTINSFQHKSNPYWHTENLSLMKRHNFNSQVGVNEKRKAGIRLGICKGPVEAGSTGSPWIKRQSV